MVEGNAKGGLTALFWGYRSSAKKREYSFELTREQFGDLTKQNCWYCDIEPSQIKYADSKKKCRRREYYIYNGIDRVDNDKGYTEANCIPCCRKCNWMKNTMSGEDFIIQIRKITRNLNIF